MVLHPVDARDIADLLEPHADENTDYHRGMQAGVALVLMLAPTPARMAALPHLLGISSESLDEAGAALNMTRQAIGNVKSRMARELGVKTQREDSKGICAESAREAWERRRRKKAPSLAEANNGDRRGPKPYTEGVDVNAGGAQ